MSTPFFPTVEDATDINQEALESFGQTNHALLRPDVLEGALGRAANHFHYGEGEESQRIANAAAALAHGVGAAQSFEDGNKRTAYWLTHMFLHENGYPHLMGDDDEEVADHLIGHGEGTHSMEDTQNLFNSRHSPTTLGHFVANILDPIHDTLEPSVWDDPDSDEPKLKQNHRKWIIEAINDALESAGYTGMDDWLSLVLTGSLTTYQYDKDSDCDISLFIDTEHFPEWSRAEMVGVMITKVDGRKLPGTPFPMQDFVVSPDVTKEDLYQPGLRSGYDLATETWINPPERDRSMDVKSQLPGFYSYALQQADKMQSLLRYEPEKAKLLWHQIHTKRRNDMKAGKGDYAQSNIIYKFLANRGLFKSLSDLTGEYIASQHGSHAKQAGPVVDHRLDHRAIDIAARKIGLKAPVKVIQSEGTHGQYLGMDKDGNHQISVIRWLKPESASKEIWHELAHALQAEQGEDVMNIPTTRTVDYDEYAAHPLEQRASELAEENSFPLALPSVEKTAAPGGRTPVAKYAYDFINHIGIMGQMGDPERENLSHNQLMEALVQQSPESRPSQMRFGEVAENGRATSYSRPNVTGPANRDVNPYQAMYEEQDFVSKAVPGASFTNPQEKLKDSWGEIDPQVIYVGIPPTVQADSDAAANASPWMFG